MLLLALVMVRPGARAAEVESPVVDPAEGYRYRETVKVTAESPDLEATEVRDPTASVTIIHVERLPPGQADLAELLAGTVGLSIRRLGGPESPSTVSIRGSSPQQVLILLDGVPLGSAEGSAVDLSTVPLGALERIEVARGSGSAAFGSGAMGGVVNLVTLQPDRRPSLSLRFSGGSYDTYRGGLDLAGRWGPTALRLHLEHGRSDGDFSFTHDNGTEQDPTDDFEERRQNNRSRSSGLLLTASTQLARDWTADLSLEGYDAERGVPGLTTFPSPHASEDESRATITARLRGEAIEARPLRASLRLHHRWTDLEFDDPYGEQTGVPSRTRQDGVLGGGEGSLAWEPGPFHLAATLGVDRESLTDESLGDRRRTSLAASGRAEWSAPQGRLRVSALLRYDHVEDREEERDPGRRWSPKLGLRWRLGRFLEVRGSAGTGFRAPSFRELYLTEGFVTGNPDLRPERSRSYDLGLRFEAPGGRAELTLFQTDCRDLIQYVMISGFRYRPLNIGRARSRGLELEAGWRPWRWLSLSGACTWMEAVDRSGEPNLDGRQIPGQPEQELLARAEGHRGFLRGHLELLHLDGNYLTRANTKWLPSRTVWNAGLGVTLPAEVELGLEARNLTDDRIVDVRGFPLPGRSLSATLRWRTDL